MPKQQVLASRGINRQRNGRQKERNALDVQEGCGIVLPTEGAPVKDMSSIACPHAQARHAAFECLSGAVPMDGGSSASSSDMFNNRSSGSNSSAEDSIRAAAGGNAGACSRPNSPLLHDSRLASAQVLHPCTPPMSAVYSVYCRLPYFCQRLINDHS